MLYYAIQALRTSGYEAVYDAVEKPLQFAQTAAVLEVSSDVPFLSLNTVC